MSIVPLSGVTAFPRIEGLPDASVAFVKGQLLYRDTSTGELKTMTATAGDVTTLEGICVQDKTTEATNPTLEYSPVFDGMLVIADCTNNTAANQLNKAHLMTDGGTVNNTSTHSTDVNAVFIALALSGAAADKKLIGRLVLRLGQAAA